MQIQVVIQAGGRGLRMGKATQILPKPLIPVGDKTMIEHVIDQFKDENITIIVNYMGELIESYVKKHNFIKEKQYRGTAGALKLFTATDDFICSNCDILIKEDYKEIYDYHRKKQADITIVVTRNVTKIPYGVFDYDVEDKLISITEKPTYTHVINTGFYVISPNVLKLINKDHMDMNELIQKCLDRNKNVYLYHITSDKFTDMGTLDAYKKYIEEIK